MAEKKDGGGKKIPSWATRLPFGLCKRYGISLPKNATPRSAWEALAGKGVSRADIYAKIREKGKPSAITTINEPVKQEEAKNTVIAETEKPKEKKTSRERFVEWQKEKHKREIERFFGGKGEHIYKKTYKFDHVIDDDNVVITTNNLQFVKDGHALIVGKNKAVFLKNWQVRHTTINDPNWGKLGTNLIKLNRNYFKVYTFRNNFEDIAIEDGEEMTNFDDVLKLAKEQDSYSKKHDVTYEVY